MRDRKSVERWLEFFLFKSRWLLAPFYLGLVVSLVMLLAAFVGELLHAMPAPLDITHADPEKVILAVLGLIDLSLAGNLVVIVIFSGYENFVVQDQHRQQPRTGPAGWARWISPA